ncbi:MAG: right-handed parallel beta-helix repeat-containing protein [Nibricoccus sp.]
MTFAIASCVRSIAAAMFCGLGKRCFITIFMMVAASCSVRADNVFAHPGVIQTAADLDFIKSKIATGEQPWTGALQRMKGPHLIHPKKPIVNILETLPKPFTHVVRGSYGRSPVGADELFLNSEVAAEAALVWYLTGEVAYREKAIELINAWSYRIWDFADNDAKLLGAWTAVNWCYAAEILRYSKSGWKENDVRQFERMLRMVYHPLLDGFYPEANGNWDAAIIAAELSMGVFLDDHAIFDRAVNHYLRGPGNGGITKYIYPSGQCQETTRDAGHVQLGLGYFVIAAQIAWCQGVDLFGAADDRLAVGLEYTARYNSGGSVSIKGIPSEPGELKDIYRAAFVHYRAKGLDTPYIKQAVASEEGRAGFTLLVAECAPTRWPQLRSKPVLRHVFAAGAGAQEHPTGEIQGDVINLSPTQSVQDAIDKLVGRGGTVVLARGIYRLPSPLKFPSGVTLAGQGKDTILFLDPKFTERGAGAAIVNAVDDLHDVEIRDLVIEGATITERSIANDPNHDRWLRSHPMVPSRGGIVFLAQFENQMHNIRLEHLTVRNCTLDGVAIAGAADVVVSKCDFYDCGGSVAPGRGLSHNLRLSHVSKVEVTGGQFGTSPRGCGIGVFNSRDIHIFGNEIARNTSHGIYVANCSGAVIAENLLEGNDGCGVMLNCSVEQSTETRLSGNLLRNNGQYGIGPLDAPGSYADNIFIDNKQN